ncbi:Rha family transcriptional regulator [Staphylococcus xylosus]|uniref:Rha family transcriptional regulator n=1 Tax=Staphylococcus xylosus TaxID=1288 RepID=UPI000D1E5362|nr:Rha family transcriptional regulator [Staphylococcus xylosus]PTI20566.1 transcriptional regulator [Staphylococcus xylosus]
MEQFNLEVFEKDGVVYTDSREVANKLGKDHKTLKRDIRQHIENLDYDENNMSTNLYTSQKYFIDGSFLDKYGRKQHQYLITKIGCDFIANKMTGRKGAQFTDAYITAFENMKEHIEHQQYQVPQTPMQALEMMFHVQKEQEQFNKQMKEEIKGIRNIVGIETKNWRNDTNKILGAIAQHLGGKEQHQTVRKEAYKLLEEKGHCKLEQRMNNRKAKMLARGATKTQISKLSKLDVISEEPRLIEIYISVIKSMAIKYGVDIKQFELQEEK